MTHKMLGAHTPRIRPGGMAPKRVQRGGLHSYTFQRAVYLAADRIINRPLLGKERKAS